MSNVWKQMENGNDKINLFKNFIFFFYFFFREISLNRTKRKVLDKSLNLVEKSKMLCEFVYPMSYFVYSRMCAQFLNKRKQQQQSNNKKYRGEKTYHRKMCIKIPSTYKVISFVYVARVGTTTVSQSFLNGNHSSAEKIRLKFAYIRINEINKQTNERKKNIYSLCMSINNRIELISLFVCVFFFFIHLVVAILTFLLFLVAADVFHLFLIQILYRIHFVLKLCHWIPGRRTFIWFV